LRKKVLDIWHNEEAVFLRKYEPKLLDVDHKFPQIRWSSNEENLNSLSDIDLKNKFILLNNADNLLKSRHCEKCVAT
jgi:hypothetical protein